MYLYKAMEHTFKEISSLLKDGPIKGKDPIFIKIFEIILSCTKQEECKQYFTGAFLLDTLKFMDSDSMYNTVLYKIYINIFSEKDLNNQLCANKSLMDSIITHSLNDIVNKNCKDADAGCMLLSNVTRSEESCIQISESLSPLSNTLHKFVCAFTTIGYNSTCSLDQLSMVLCNLSQLPPVRTILTQTNHCMLQKLVPFINHECSIRRRGIIGLVHNCAFDSSVHEWMLGDEVDILPRLLLPLAGPEQFDDEDNDKLPVDLQYLPETKTRESDPEVRRQLLETLNQLCATKYGRQFLRDHNAYVILRELHKWEKDQSAFVACENVVDILIRTEDEIGVDHLKNVEIPADLEEKFNKELTT